MNRSSRAVKSLGRALRLARSVKPLCWGATLKELSAELGLPKSTVPPSAFKPFTELGYVRRTR
ncbi:MAG: hypothetical protein IMX04_08860 [Candidatus Carbobacillus altaicus]|nr:hypothetical protein [Candidatus Carbobacillus altaicus]